ncbi:MAG: type II secretion system F family protein [Pseudomonadota bacterium]
MKRRIVGVFGIPMNVILIAVLIAACTMSFAAVLLFPRLKAENRTNQRLKDVRRKETNTKARSAAEDAAKRRKNVQDTLKEIEERSNSKRKNQITISIRIARAGLKMSKTTYFALSAFAAIAMGLIAIVAGAPHWAAAGLAFFGMLGLPRMVLSTLAKRRVKKFTEELPDAVDVIVRGVKAGLPLNDCLRVVAAEAKEPVAGEFLNIVESQQLGIPVGEAVQKMHENIPTAETNFFATVIAIQQTSGGSLSEALGNLSKVLRERKKMRNKVQAISAEAKSSALIIGALPILVGIAVSVMNPDFISPLFTTSLGHIIIGCGVGMMFTGTMVMRKMINFEV